MTVDVLEPRVDLLCEEYVLVQAWKKTASYIRAHNWYADTLELDRAAVNLPRFIGALAEQLSAPDEWTNDPLRIVPAPKTQQWRVTPGTYHWEPVSGISGCKLRPLAHVSLKDQVAATAVMLCLANRVETIQGDPRESITNAEARKQVTSYGNRLFCDATDGGLRHRWGSQKLYRAYFQDYRTFLLRPELAAEEVNRKENVRVVIVHSDLRQFYDRVRPELLAQKIDALEAKDDPRFFAFARRLLNWTWDKKDTREVAEYATQAELADFTKVSLPQGLVAAGFFSNVSMLDFDSAVQRAVSQEIAPGVRLDDICRYVDDLRIVLTVTGERTLSDLEFVATTWLQVLLDRHAEGLKPSRDKTVAAELTGDARPLVRQSRKMARIQRAVSGGFDAIGGEEILEAVQGLIRSQQRYAKSRTDEQGWLFSPIPDVRDATVARFAAGRFRTTYRSLRPLLAEGEDDLAVGTKTMVEAAQHHSRRSRTQAELDDDARAFALGLIEYWVEDPSNVRLLRIGLDLWPAQDVLKEVLGLLRPFTETSGQRKAPRRVAWYCLSEVLRAGATETGFVEDGESLPASIDISVYRATLRAEAIRLASLPPRRLPWYLRQQVLLYLAASGATHTPRSPSVGSPETRHYRELLRFLNGEGSRMKSSDFATLAILSRRSFRDRDAAVQLVSKDTSAHRLEQIAERDPSFALEILATRPDLSTDISPRVRDDLCLQTSAEEAAGWTSLSEAILHNEPTSPLRNELTLLRFAAKFLESTLALADTEAIRPSDVRLKLSIGNGQVSEVEEIKITPTRVASAGSMYQPPIWCPVNERWRFHLGYLLRFILTARQDFTKVVRSPSWRESAAIYRVPQSHWYQRLYGLFNKQSVFGQDWLPISDWPERLLSALLRWPGCRTFEMDGWVRGGVAITRDFIDDRIRVLSDKQGRSSGVLMLPVTAGWPVKAASVRPLRACVVQTVIPTPDDFTLGDLTLSGAKIRKRHRNHLSAALAAIERMLALRETHKGLESRLDLLILPELSVYPRDVRTHLLPFARAHRTIVLAGLTYQALSAGQPLVNAALWLIPQWSSEYGLQVIVRWQGKQHHAPDEKKLNVGGPIVQGFRPCQWLVGYEWSGRTEDVPLWLTASVCYDATDLTLAADLRNQSDVLAIPALNKDVGTFDQMALALHYHMFQLVVIANNGLYGGSNAYSPYRDLYVRQIFHLHGQPQASVAFLEIDDIGAFLKRKVAAQSQATFPATPGASPWKFPPAGI